MFTEENPIFEWQHLGNIEIGRPNLGDSTSVSVYRLMQFTLRTAIIQEVGCKKAAEIFINAGRMAGAEFCRNILNRDLEFNDFIAQLQQKLKEMKIGVLRIEEANLGNFSFTLTVAEDLDCSGLPVTGETVCDFDEGFIAGVLDAYTGKAFEVKEVDCWASGGRVCRFSAALIKDSGA